MCYITIQLKKKKVKIVKKNKKQKRIKGKHYKGNNCVSNLHEWIKLKQKLNNK